MPFTIKITEKYAESMKMCLIAEISHSNGASESDKDDFLEICWLVEACWISIGGLPSQISDWLVCGIVNSQHVDHELGLRLSSSDYVKPDLEPSIPPI